MSEHATGPGADSDARTSSAGTPPQQQPAAVAVVAVSGFLIVTVWAEALVDVVAAGSSNSADAPAPAPPPIRAPDGCGSASPDWSPAP